MTTFESVTSQTAPWVHRATRSQADLIRRAATGVDILVIELDGSRMRTVRGLFEEYIRKFSFPANFGWNWNAFDDRLYDLQWLPARKYLTIVTHAGEVLLNERDALENYVRHLEIIGKRWSTTVGLGYEWGHGEVPFHTVLVEDE
ncbi:barstar family protein [Arthrobacter bambusae]|uniref:Peptidoglycan/xylan/chitin deacetylase (PgdA/CDA1 family) n=1 Tax=Arthrobacter bambusae TaxID=1338426 RepID=A0AAW8DB06_9MICC|nr:barstar family protein [Arthrobacter bambusae]MDP9903111.1 peptidoglycan/xylan/chitin deacetylase (PgdA/CDA1 family) [Arthrobacter bambusae]MDQ0128895.1 peptidoglycan/xylan/chitin deacetylase (PgdA/CDA1 family) [Arthrobacter bambusae]MDQ0180236.1 peptidoglycan/xylan/chitin deacetylase (PgdA/CDA1 family) [Arthrobacter bambusae]